MKKIVLLLLCWLPLIVLSQDFEVAPVLMNFTEEPGSTSMQKLNIKNYANTRQKFSLLLSDYTIDREGKKINMSEGSTPNSISSWLTINPSIIELNPNESGQVDVVLTVPVDHYEARWGMIHVQVARERTMNEIDKQLSTGVLLVPRIVVLMKQEPGSNTNYEARIQKLEEVTSENDSFRKFRAEIVNTGDKVIDAEVYLALANITTAEEKKYNSTKVTVYPGFTRSVVLQLSEKIPAGQYALAAIMDYGHRKPIEGTQIIIEQK